MTHEDEGHYGLKHKGKTLDSTIAKALEKRADNGTVSCSAVHAVASELAIPPAEAGVQADLMELRLTRCSLGLFGYGAEENKLMPAESVLPDLSDAIDNAADEGRISCLACWIIAKATNTKRKDVAAACEAKKLKIKPCQLGAF